MHCCGDPIGFYRPTEFTNFRLGLFPRRWDIFLEWLSQCIINSQTYIVLSRSVYHRVWKQLGRRWLCGPLCGRGSGARGGGENP